MTPTETLEHEHKIILHVLDSAEREVQYIAETGKVHTDRVEQILDFLRNFADKCHHAKEEKLLFVKMQERGMSADTGPISVMLQDHNDGRAAIRAIAEALPDAEMDDPSAVDVIHDNLAAYIQLLRNHIWKEDNVLYPAANQLLTQEDQQELAKGFDKVEAEEIGEGVHEKYHQLAHELAEV